MIYVDRLGVWLEGESPQHPPGPKDFAFGPITRRERQVLSLVAEGYQNKEIAKELGLRLYTVKNHLHNIFVKLGVFHRRAAVQSARERGVL